MINAKNVSFAYDEDSEDVIKNLSMKIEDGEFVVIIGHNGSGKSTLSKMYNAIQFPQSGSIIIDGLDTSLEENIWEVRRTAGMVFQNPDNQLVATIVEEDVAFGPENLGVPQKEIVKRVDEALETVHMNEFRNKSPHHLSGGQKQRIAIAGILAMRPKCIIFDEPTAMLDPSGRKEVMDTIEKLNKEENITILHITHYMNEAVNADRIIVMDKGKKVMEGKPREIFSRVKELRSLGLDVPQVTLLSNILKSKGISVSADNIVIEELVEELCQLL